MRGRDADLEPAGGTAASAPPRPPASCATAPTPEAEIGTNPRLAARLRPFDPAAAAVVSGWLTDDKSLFWVAPKTPPPITPEKVVGWSTGRGGARLLAFDGHREPVGYGELHFMPNSKTHLWLGHLVLAPGWRGRGLGTELTRLLLSEAFEQWRAQRVSLIVFPDNHAAIKCYRRAGFIHLGTQKKFFETTRCHHKMDAMSIDRVRYGERFPRSD